MPFYHITRYRADYVHRVIFFLRRIPKVKIVENLSDVCMHNVHCEIAVGSLNKCFLHSNLEIFGTTGIISLVLGLSFK